MPGVIGTVRTRSEVKVFVGRVIAGGTAAATIRRAVRRAEGKPCAAGRMLDRQILIDLMLVNEIQQDFPLMNNADILVSERNLEVLRELG